MRFGIVGGGPAGLYLAILLKRDDPGRDVRIVERNPPDATFGWGVVFSEDTLTELRDADYETFLGLDEEIVRWSAIDVHRRGSLTRAYGHGFSAIRRTSLLRVLQERARGLGVTLTFEEEVPGPEALADCDVVVGADGVNSTVRRGRQEAFGTHIAEHETRFAWFGTDHVFDVFTFVFRETPDGLYTVHAYPFDADASTFIVECREETWRRAGLDEMGEEESLAHCETLFADVLEGGRLLSNRSVWTSFLTVRNRSWHDGNVVLVGDAAHTAHFSIGSGTKLAVEDAIALAKSFAAHGGDLPAVFATYEAERQAPVERFQEAATDSARYFATVSRYLDFGPEQFAYNLLTRSGRITHLSLEGRDPAVANLAGRALASAATGDPAEAARVVRPSPLHTPLRIAHRTVPNRVAVACTPLDAADDGHPGSLHAGQITAAVDSGAGLVVTEMIAVHRDGRVTPGSPGLYEPTHAARWADVLESSRGDAPALVAARLGHAGRRGATRPRRDGLDRPLRTGAWPLVAPSPIPYLPGGPVPGDLGDVAGRLVEAFADAARRAADAGFDVLLLDASDGYLLASCLSPLANRRDDRLGGDPERRLRFPLDVLAAVRDAWPEQRPLLVRLTADDRHPDGITPEAGAETAARLVAEGAHLVEVTAGHTVPWGSTAPDYRRGFLLDLATAVRNDGRVPVAAGGRITTLDEVDTIVAAGRADLVVADLGAYRRDVVRRTGSGS